MRNIIRNSITFFVLLNYLVAIKIDWDFISNREHLSFEKDMRCDIITIKDFDNFSEIEFVVPLDLEDYNERMLKLIPKNPIIFDQPLSILIRSAHQFFTIALLNLLGFNFNTSIISNGKRNNLTVESLILIVQYSEIKFYQNGKVIKNCHKDLKNLELFDNHQFRFLILIFDSYNKYSDKPYCPYFFSNVRVQFLCIAQQTNTFIRINMFSFLNTNRSEINSYIGFYRIDLYYLSIDITIVNKDIFSRTRYVYLSGVIDRIQTDLFKYFSFKKIFFKLKNMREFLHKSTDWLNYLNLRFNFTNDSQIDLYLLKNTNMDNILFLGLMQVDRYYDFPLEDLCLFKNFPHNRLVYPVLYRNNYSQFDSCSCTVLWLISKTKIYQNYVAFTNANSKLFDDFLNTIHIMGMILHTEGINYIQITWDIIILIL